MEESLPGLEKQVPQQKGRNKKVLSKSVKGDSKKISKSGRTRTSQTKQKCGPKSKRRSLCEDKYPSILNPVVLLGQKEKETIDQLVTEKGPVINLLDISLLQSYTGVSNNQKLLSPGVKSGMSRECVQKSSPSEERASNLLREKAKLEKKVSIAITRSPGGRPKKEKGNLVCESMNTGSPARKYRTPVLSLLTSEMEQRKRLVGESACLSVDEECPKADKSGQNDSSPMSKCEKDPKEKKQEKADKSKSLPGKPSRPNSPRHPPSKGNSELLEPVSSEVGATKDDSLTHEQLQQSEGKINPRLSLLISRVKAVVSSECEDSNNESDKESVSENDDELSVKDSEHDPETPSKDSSSDQSPQSAKKKMSPFKGKGDKASPGKESVRQLEFINSDHGTTKDVTDTKEGSVSKVQNVSSVTAVETSERTKDVTLNINSPTLMVKKIMKDGEVSPERAKNVMLSTGSPAFSVKKLMNNVSKCRDQVATLIKNQCDQAARRDVPGKDVIQGSGEISENKAGNQQEVEKSQLSEGLGMDEKISPRAPISLALHAHMTQKTDLQPTNPAVVKGDRKSPDNTGSVENSLVPVRRLVVSKKENIIDLRVPTESKLQSEPLDLRASENMNEDCDVVSQRSPGDEDAKPKKGSSLAKERLMLEKLLIRTAGVPGRLISKIVRTTMSGLECSTQSVPQTARVLQPQLLVPVSTSEYGALQSSQQRAADIQISVRPLPQAATGLQLPSAGRSDRSTDSPVQTVPEQTDSTPRKKASAFFSEELEHYLENNSEIQLIDQARKQKSPPSKYTGTDNSGAIMKQMVEYPEPDIDEIDDVFILSFPSKDAMDYHVSKQALEALDTGSDSEEEIDILRSPSKTNDVTKIKGWQKKFPKDLESDSSKNAANIDWNSQDTLVKKLLPEEIKSMGFHFRKRKKKGMLGMKNNKQASPSHQKSSSDQAGQAGGDRPRRPWEQPKLTAKERQAASRIFGRTADGKFLPKSVAHKGGGNCPRYEEGPPIVTQTMALAALEALQTPSRPASPETLKVPCEKPGCRYGCVCYLCDTAEEPNVQEPTESPRKPKGTCDKEYCRLGCICDSIDHEAAHAKEQTAAKECRKPACMLDCMCDSSSKSKTDELPQVVRRSSRPKKSKFALIDENTLIFADEDVVFEGDAFYSSRRKRKGNQGGPSTSGVGKQGKNKGRLPPPQLTKEVPVMAMEEKIQETGDNLVPLYMIPQRGKERKILKAKSRDGTVEKYAVKCPKCRLLIVLVVARHVVTTIHQGIVEKAEIPSEEEEMNFDLPGSEEEDDPNKFSCARTMIYVPVRREKRCACGEKVSICGHPQPTPAEKKKKKRKKRSDKKEKLIEVVSIPSPPHQKTHQPVLKPVHVTPGQAPRAMPRFIPIQPAPPKAAPQEPAKAPPAATGKPKERAPFKTQMVLLQRKGKDGTTPVAEGDKLPHLLQVTSDCEWGCIRYQLLSKISSMAENVDYPPAARFMLGTFQVTVCAKPKMPTPIPKSLQGKLPSRMYPIPVVITMPKPEEPKPVTAVPVTLIKNTGALTKASVTASTVSLTKAPATTAAAAMSLKKPPATTAAAMSLQPVTLSQDVKPGLYPKVSFGTVRPMSLTQQGFTAQFTSSGIVRTFKQDGSSAQGQGTPVLLYGEPKVSQAVLPPSSANETVSNVVTPGETPLKVVSVVGSADTVMEQCKSQRPQELIGQPMVDKSLYMTTVQRIGSKRKYKGPSDKPRMTSVLKSKAGETVPLKMGSASGTSLFSTEPVIEIIPDGDPWDTDHVSVTVKKENVAVTGDAPRGESEEANHISSEPKQAMTDNVSKEAQEADKPTEDCTKDSSSTKADRSAVADSQIADKKLTDKGVLDVSCEDNDLRCMESDFDSDKDACLSKRARPADKECTEGDNSQVSCTSGGGSPPSKKQKLSDETECSDEECIVHHPMADGDREGDSNAEATAKSLKSKLCKLGKRKTCLFKMDEEDNEEDENVKKLKDCQKDIDNKLDMGESTEKSKCVVGTDSSCDKSENTQDSPTQKTDPGSKSLTKETKETSDAMPPSADLSKGTEGKESKKSPPVTPGSSKTSVSTQSLLEKQKDLTDKQFTEVEGVSQVTIPVSKLQPLLASKQVKLMVPITMSGSGPQVAGPFILSPGPNKHDENLPLEALLRNSQAGCAETSTTKCVSVMISSPSGSSGSAIVQGLSMNDPMFKGYPSSKAQDKISKTSSPAITTTVSTSVSPVVSDGSPKGGKVPVLAATRVDTPTTITSLTVASALTNNSSTFTSRALETSVSSSANDVIMTSQVAQAQSCCVPPKEQSSVEPKRTNLATSEDVPSDTADQASELNAKTSVGQADLFAETGHKSELPEPLDAVINKSVSSDVPESCVEDVDKLDAEKSDSENSPACAQSVEKTRSESPSHVMVDDENINSSSMEVSETGTDLLETRTMADGEDALSPVLSTDEVTSQSTGEGKSVIGDKKEKVLEIVPVDEGTSGGENQEVQEHSQGLPEDHVTQSVLEHSDADCKDDDTEKPELMECDSHSSTGDHENNSGAHVKPSVALGKDEQITPIEIVPIEIAPDSDREEVDVTALDDTESMLSKDTVVHGRMNPGQTSAPHSGSTWMSYSVAGDKSAPSSTVTSSHQGSRASTPAEDSEQKDPFSLAALQLSQQQAKSDSSESDDSSEDIDLYDTEQEEMVDILGEDDDAEMMQASLHLRRVLASSQEKSHMIGYKKRRKEPHSEMVEDNAEFQEEVFVIAPGYRAKGEKNMGRERQRRRELRFKFEGLAKVLQLPSDSPKQAVLSKAMETVQDLQNKEVALRQIRQAYISRTSQLVARLQYLRACTKSSGAEGVTVNEETGIKSVSVPPKTVMDIDHLASASSRSLLPRAKSEGATPSDPSFPTVSKLLQIKGAQNIKGMSSAGSARLGTESVTTCKPSSSGLQQRGMGADSVTTCKPSSSGIQQRVQLKDPSSGGFVMAKEGTSNFRFTGGSKVELNGSPGTFLRIEPVMVAETKEKDSDT